MHLTTVLHPPSCQCHETKVNDVPFCHRDSERESCLKSGCYQFFPLCYTHTKIKSLIDYVFFIYDTVHKD